MRLALAAGGYVVAALVAAFALRGRRDLRLPDRSDPAPPATDAFAERDAMYRSLVEQLPAIIYVESAADHGRTLYVSPQIERYLGYPPERWVGDPQFWTQILHPDDRDRVVEECEWANAQGLPFNSEYRMRTADGRHVWFRDSARLVRDEHGGPLRWNGMMIEVTSEKETERVLRESARRG